MLRKVRNYGDSITAWQERHNVLLGHENHIRKELSTIQESFIYIGIHLCDIENQALYDTVYCQVSGNYCKNIFEYALQELDIGRSTVYNLMAVARTFAKPCGGLLPKYRDYSYSQLVELLTFEEEERKYADPHLSVRELRSLKRGDSVRWVDEEGFCHDCRLPKLLECQEDRPDVWTESNTSPQIETPRAIVTSEDRPDVWTELNDSPQIENPPAIAAEAPSDFEEIIFLDEIEFTRWYYEHYNNETIYPLKVIVPAKRS